MWYCLDDFSRTIKPSFIFEIIKQLRKNGKKMSLNLRNMDFRYDFAILKKITLKESLGLSCYPLNDVGRLHDF